MELEGKFESLSPVHGLPGNSAQYSDCFVEPDGRYVFEVFAYHVFRKDDNVTVFVLRQAKNGNSWRMYGPFHSAYRK